MRRPYRLDLNASDPCPHTRMRTTPASEQVGSYDHVHYQRMLGMPI